jgi:transposase
MAQYMVRLTQEERQPLSTLITTGRAAAAKLLHARILLKADDCEGSRCWTDAEIAVAVDTSESTVHRVRQAFVAQGWEAALSRQRPTGRPSRQLDGAQEAQLIA